MLFVLLPKKFWLSCRLPLKNHYTRLQQRPRLANWLGRRGYALSQAQASLARTADSQVAQALLAFKNAFQATLRSVACPFPGPQALLVLLQAVQTDGCFLRAPWFFGASICGVRRHTPTCSSCFHSRIIFFGQTSKFFFLGDSALSARDMPQRAKGVRTLLNQPHRAQVYQYLVATPVGSQSPGNPPFRREGMCARVYTVAL